MIVRESNVPCSSGTAYGVGKVVIESPTQSGPKRFHVIAYFVDGIPEGKGAILSEDKAFEFEGEIRNWRPYNGQALQRQSDGSVLAIDFRDGVRSIASSQTSPSTDQIPQQRSVPEPAGSNSFAQTLAALAAGLQRWQAAQPSRQAQAPVTMENWGKAGGQSPSQMQDWARVGGSPPVVSRPPESHYPSIAQQAAAADARIAEQVRLSDARSAALQRAADERSAVQQRKADEAAQAQRIAEAALLKAQQIEQERQRQANEARLRQQSADSLAAIQKQAAEAAARIAEQTRLADAEALRQKREADERSAAQQRRADQAAQAQRVAEAALLKAQQIEQEKQRQENEGRLRQQLADAHAATQKQTAAADARIAEQAKEAQARQKSLEEKVKPVAPLTIGYSTYGTSAPVAFLTNSNTRPPKSPAYDTVTASPSAPLHAPGPTFSSSNISPLFRGCDYIPSTSILGRRWTSQEVAFVENCKQRAFAQATDASKELEIWNKAEAVRNGAEIAGDAASLGLGVGEVAVLTRGIYIAGKAGITKLVEKEALNATLKTANKKTVSAEAKIVGSNAKFIDMNQTARSAQAADIKAETLIADRVISRDIKLGEASPNGNMETAHAEIGAIEQAFKAGETVNAKMKMTVSGAEVCGYCRGDIPAEAEKAGLKELILIEKKSGTTFYWKKGMTKLLPQSK